MFNTCNNFVKDSKWLSYQRNSNFKLRKNKCFLYCDISCKFRYVRCIVPSCTQWTSFLFEIDVMFFAFNPLIRQIFCWEGRWEPYDSITGTIFDIFEIADQWRYVPYRYRINIIFEIAFLVTKIENISAIEGWNYHHVNKVTFIQCFAQVF